MPEDLEEQRKRWQEQYAASRKRDADFTTLSGEEVAPLHSPLDREGEDVAERIGFPGQHPYTRGVYPSMYRGRPWTIRQFSGFGNARETNERYKYLIGQGGGGLSVAFDMPTLMGRDSDEPRSLGEVGHCGVAIDSAADMDLLFDSIPLGDVTTSMTISGAADLGALDARCLRRQDRARAVAAVPHPDRGRVPDRAAARQQRGPHGDR